MLILILLIATSGACFAQGGHYPHHHHHHHYAHYPQRPAYPGYPPQQGGGRRPGPQHGIPTGIGGPISFSSEEGGGQQRGGRMQVLYSWKQVDFVFPNAETRQRMIQNQQFIPLNNLILDVDVYGEGPNRVVFVTVPRVRPGVPVTLATVGRRRNADGENLLEPFPDWRSNNAYFNNDCDNGITSVFRTHMDECGRLWVLDSGSINAFNGNSSIPCNPKVLIYDVRNNNRLIGSYPIPRSLIADNTLLVTIAVDTRSRDCSDAFAYIADSIAYKMIVFNHQTGQFWRINNILFFPYPDQSRFTVNGVSFDLMGGIFGLSIGPKFRGSRRLYFQCIDSVKQSWVDADVLRNGSLWQSNMNASPRAFNLFSGSRPSQSAAAAMSDQGVMYFGLIGSNEIVCWNSQRRFGGRNLVSLAKDDVTLQFNSGIKVFNGKLYATSSRLQNYLTNRIDASDQNYRVLEGDLRRLTEGTSCKVSCREFACYEPYTSGDDDECEGVECITESVEFHPNTYQPFGPDDEPIWFPT